MDSSFRWNDDLDTQALVSRQAANTTFCHNNFLSNSAFLASNSSLVSIPLVIKS